MDELPPLSSGSRQDVHIYSFVYADDGLLLVSGPRYRKTVKLCVILGALLSWAKTRGGQHVECLAYQVDARRGRVGVSAKKVESWIQTALTEGSVFGRTMKAALGRMGFLAGPLKHARPFLALIYKWTAKLSSQQMFSDPSVSQVGSEVLLGGS